MNTSELSLTVKHQNLIKFSAVGDFLLLIHFCHWKFTENIEHDKEENGQILPNAPKKASHWAKETVSITCGGSVVDGKLLKCFHHATSPICVNPPLLIFTSCQSHSLIGV